MPTARRSTPLPVCSSVPLVSAGQLGLELKLSSLQPPTHAGRCPARASPHPCNRPKDHPLPREWPGGYLSRTSGAARDRLSSSRRDLALPAGRGGKMDSQLRRAPPPALLFQLLDPPPGPASLLFCLPGLAFPRGGGWGVGEVRRVSFRCRQPPPTTATAGGAPSNREGLGLLAFLPSRVAARATEHRAQSWPSPRARKQTATAETRRLGLWSSGDRRWSHPGRKLALNKMVGFGLLYFFFCSLHF